MNSPKISVIVPLYNAEKYLHNCVDSILSQTFTDFELLLINDGSKDSSGKICDEYATLDSRVRVFHKENGGVSSARNLGLDNAQGEWITFVDSDDEFVDNNCLTLLYQPKFDLINYGYECYDVNGKKTLTTSIFHNEFVLDRDKAISYVYSCDYYQFYSVAKLYCNSIIKKNNIRFDESLYYSEDRLFIIEYLSYCKKIYSSSHSIYKYVMRINGAMSSINNEFNNKTLTGFYAALKMLDAVKKMGTTESNIKLARKDVVQSYQITIRYLTHYGIKDNSIRCDLRTRLKNALPLIEYIYIKIKYILKGLLGTPKMSK